MRTRLFFALFCFVSAVFAGCSPVQQFYMKEKVTNATPRQGIVEDRFFYGKASGKVDVLFVVDNTGSGEAALPTFQKAYTDFVSRLSGPDAQLLDYRVQVATDPSGATPGNYTSGSTPPDLQLAELFGAAGSSSSPLLNHKELGNLNPFVSAARGLTDKAFKPRDFSPIFMVFLLGWDVDPTQSLATDTAAFAAAMQKSRGFHQSHLVTLSRVTSGGPGNTGFPHCNSFSSAPSALAQLQSLPWRSHASLDLCDDSWASFAEPLFTDILAFKKKFVLSQVPDAPETMFMQSAGNHRLYRYGDDYRLDQKNNEIVFLRDPGLQEGQPFEVQYYPPAVSSDPTAQNPPGPIPAGS